MSLYDLTVKTLAGAPQPLAAYRGKVALVVNTASECGFTPQYASLQLLYEDYAPKGFVILGFPSNDFGAQEPGTPGEIQTFCERNFGVTFPLFEKVATQGAARSPVFALLAERHGAPAWNFHKYLVGKRGEVRAAFPSSVEPDDAALVAAIEAALAE